MKTCKKPDPKLVAAVAGATVVAGVAAYTIIGRRWHNRWGATDAEIAMELPGDDIVRRPNMNSTRAITIEATPDDIWPWIVQMGKGRGGLYSYDWLDIAFRALDEPSVEKVLEQYQVLKAGEVIPIGDDSSSMDDFYVHIVQPHYTLVIGANDPEYRQRVSWAIVLLPVGQNKTRLIMRVRGEVPMDAKGVVTYALMDPTAFIMLRKQMLNFKKLGEKMRRQRESAE